MCVEAEQVGEGMENLGLCGKEKSNPLNTGIMNTHIEKWSNASPKTELDQICSGNDLVITNSSTECYIYCYLHSTAIGSGAITASHRNSAVENSGFSFLKCTVNGTGRVYLGRAWRKYSRTVYSFCNVDGIINPAGWSDWGDPSRRGTVWFVRRRAECHGLNHSAVRKQDHF